ncbi:ATP-binding protein [Massilia sp.]|uniref:ATP-binding protein n=1 Tax=Massilia sp. TaxID=1882437 RepID=UPI0028A0F854|nr:ATP-binding protein [Massilia sp.]
MKIRTYLLLMIGAIIVPVFLLAAIALRTLLQAEREAALHTLSETASATALLVDRELGSAEAALRVLARSPHLATGDMQGFYRHATSADRGDGGRTILFAPSGQQIINTVQPLGAPLPPPPDYVRVRTRRVIETQKTVVSGLISGAVQKIPVTTINVPVPLDGGRRYVLASVFSPDYFSKVIARRTLAPGWKLSVVDTEGHVIARTGEAARFGQFANPALMRAAAGHVEGLARYDTRAGVDAYHAFFRSPMSGWLVTVSVPARDIEGVAQRAVTLAAAGMLLALLCAAAAAALFGRRLLRAIQDAGGSAAMLSRGEVPSSGASGIAEVDRLQHALHDAGAKLSHAAAERAALLQREQEARVLAEQQVETRDDFLAMLSHELRNPLSGIVGATQLLRGGPASPALKERAHDILLRQSKHLTRIVDDLLDLARLARGKVELDMRPLDLAAVTGAVVDALRVGGRVAHTLRCDLAPAWIRGDPTRIEQVVGNLVGNALKYTPAGGTVEIVLTVDEGQARLTVRDDGIGIAPELLPRLFDIFVQGKVTLDRTQGGLGIGLSVVRSLVELHGGSIEAASDGPGKGSTFTLRLPLLAEPPADANRTAPAPAPVAAARSGAEARADDGNSTVLLIEDNDDARTMLAAQLAAAGCRVLEAANGPDGIALARQGIRDWRSSTSACPGWTATRSPPPCAPSRRWPPCGCWR